MCFEALAIAAAASVLGNCGRDDDRVRGARDRRDRRNCRRRDDRGVESERSNRCDDFGRNNRGVESELFRRGIEPTMNIHRDCCCKRKHDHDRCCD